MTNKKKPINLSQQKKSIDIEKINEPIKVEITNTSSEKESFLSKNVVSIVSGMISVIALCFTFWQSGKIREHNKLSVTPLLQFSFFNNYSDNSIQFTLKNKGTGPAIIDDLIFTSNNKKSYFSSELLGNFWDRIFKEKKFPDSIFYNNVLTYSLSPGSAISPNEEIEILRFNQYELAPEVYVSSLSHFATFKLKIKYHSIYNISKVDSLEMVGLKVISFF